MRFLAFATRRALSGIWRNRLMTGAALLTMTLMLLLAAGLVVVLSGLDAGLRFVEGKVEVVAYLSDAADRDDAAALATELSARPEVAGVDHVTKDEALARYRAELRARGRDDLLDTIGFNPLPASLEVRLRDPSRAGDVVERLRAARFVDEVQETARVARALSSLATTLRGIGVLVVSAVGLVVLAIVVNAIRVGVLARREEIAVMRLVGASDAYVRWPFVLEGILVGLGGALLALAVLGLAAAPLGTVARSIVAQVPVGFDERLAQQLVALLLLAGPGLGFVGAWLSVRAHLRR